MDTGRLFYQIARIYVWLLLFTAIGTVGLIAIPRITPTATMAGVWFAVSGFGMLVIVMAMLLYLFN